MSLWTAACGVDAEHEVSPSAKNSLASIRALEAAFLEFEAQRGRSAEGWLREGDLRFFSSKFFGEPAGDVREILATSFEPRQGLGTAVLDVSSFFPPDIESYVQEDLAFYHEEARRSGDDDIYARMSYGTLSFFHTLRCLRILSDWLEWAYQLAMLRKEVVTKGSGMAVRSLYLDPAAASPEGPKRVHTDDNFLIVITALSDPGPIVYRPDGEVVESRGFQSVFLSGNERAEHYQRSFARVRAVSESTENGPLPAGDPQPTFYLGTEHQTPPQVFGWRDVAITWMDLGSPNGMCAGRAD